MLNAQPNPAGFRADILSVGSPFVGSATYDFKVVHEAAASGSGGKFTFSLTNGSVTGNVAFRGAGANSSIT